MSSRQPPIASLIPRYELKKIIGQGAMSTVYEGVREGRKFAVKVFKKQSAENSILGFRKEAAALARISHPFLVKVIEVDEFQGQAYFVMELVTGESLARILERGPLPLPKLLSLARSLAEVIGEIHRCGVVHRDLKPANILMEPKGTPKIIDFGLATRFQETPHQQADESSESSLAGTLLYCSPEQLGMIKHFVDGRSDLYSLGCVLYESATGHLPINKSNLTDLIQAHASKEVKDPRELRADLPRSFSAIIMKLLEKDPESRYSNALQLARDLAQIADFEKALSEGQEIHLDRRDAISSQLETPLVGREPEIKRLLNHWSSVLHGQGAITIIEGESGSGKSRLVRELIKKAQTDHAIVLAGKSTMGSTLPFGALREALDRLLKESSLLPELQKGQIQTKIRKAIGEFAPLLKGFTSELSHLLSDVKEALDVGSQDIYFEAIATFILRLTTEFEAVLFFLDDIQWIDEASRKVLGRLSRRLKQSKLMIAATSRDEEENGAARILFDTEIQAAQPETIKLEALSPSATTQLIELYLGLKVGSGEFKNEEFVTRLINLSQGSPLAIGEYLRVMLDAGCLYPSWGSWVADLSEIEKLNLSSDVIQLIVRRISGLDPDTQRVHKVASVLGSQFDQTILQKILRQDISKALYLGTQAHLLEMESHGKYFFVHDRVQEALLSNLTPEELRDIHLEAANILESLTRQDQPTSDTPQTEPDSKLIFALARHCAQGYPEKNPARTYFANLKAGSLALETYSYKEAVEFFSNAEQIHFKAHLTEDRIPLLEGQAEAAMRNNKYPEAASYLTQALELAKDPLQRARIYTHILEAQLGMGDLLKIVENTQLGLKELRRSLPKSELSLLLSVLVHGAAGLFLSNTGLFFGSARGEDAEKKRLLSKLYSSGIVPALAQNKVLMSLNFIFKQIYTAHFLGKTPELIESYANYALFFGKIRLMGAFERYCERALTLAKQLGNPIHIVKAKTNIVIATLFAGQYAKCEERVKDCYASEEHWITRSASMMIAGVQSMNLKLRGYAEEANAYVELLIPTRETISVHDIPGLASPLAGRMSQRAVLGEFQEAAQDKLWIAELDIQKMIEGKDIAQFSMLCNYFISYYTELDEFGENLEYWYNAYVQMKVSPTRAGLTGWFFCVYSLYARIRECWREKMATGQVPAEKLKLLKRAVKLIRKCNHPLTEAHSRVGIGVLAWLSGNQKRAMRFLNAAEALARAGDNPWAQFEAIQFRAAVFQERGNLKAATSEAKIALSIAQEHKWIPRIRKLKQAFHLESSTAVSLSGVSLNRHGIAGTSNPRPDSLQHEKLKRHLDALLRLNRASAHLGTFSSQTRTTLDEVVKIMNAERGFLFLTPEGNAGPLQIHMARNTKGEDIQHESSFSRTIVEKVRATGSPLIFAGDQGNLSVSQSIVVHQLRSMMAAPLKVDQKLIGVLYLDSTLSRGLFQEADLEVLVAISGHLSISLEAARARQLEYDKSLLEKEQELTEVRLKSAHAAGMAEIASGAIHNIGNTLTGAVTSFELLKNKVRTSRLSTFFEASSVLEQNQTDLKGFVATKPNAVPLLTLLIKLGSILKQEQQDTVKGMDSISKSLENVMAVVVMQETYAKVGLHKETAETNDFIEEVLQIQSIHFTRDQIKIEKNFGQLPPALIQKNKLLNVLVNLLDNAREALEDHPDDQRLIKIETSFDAAEIIVKITDNGKGILPENLQKIFSPGFSTKPGGHGFGLHTCANALTEMGGSIQAQSPGLNHGATFTLRMPRSAVQIRAA